SHALVPHGRRGHERVPRFAHEAAPGGYVISVAACPLRNGVGDRAGVGVRQPVWRVGDDCVNGLGWHGVHGFDAVAVDYFGGVVVVVSVHLFSRYGLGVSSYSSKSTQPSLTASHA